MRAVALAGAIGRLEDDGTVAALDLPFPHLAAFLAGGGRLGDLERVRVRVRMPAGDAPLASAVAAGVAVWGIGMNYRSKQAVTGRPTPAEPALFLKAPSAFGEPGHPIVLPVAETQAVDYEGEIAVVIGTHLHMASVRQAAAAVAAAGPANDVTARDVMARTGQPTLAKSYPGFGQLSGVFAEPESLEGPDGITLSTTVNGADRQRDSSSGMLLPIPDLLARLSRHAVLRPGDVVMTGTPAGTGDETHTYLASGDRVEVTVGDLPPLVSMVVAGATAGAANGPPPGPGAPLAAHPPGGAR